MTKEELRALIDSDTQATEMAQVGNDAGCAARCSEIAPKVPGPERYIHGMDLVSAFADPAVGADAWAKLKAAAGANPVVALAVEYMGPSSVRGLNISDERSLAMCDALKQSGVWTQAQADGVKALGMVPQTITADEVSEAMASDRVTFRDEEDSDWAPQIEEGE